MSQERTTKVEMFVVFVFQVGNQEAVDMVRPLFTNFGDSPSLLPACKKLVDLSATRGSTDDISVMIIPLRSFI